MMKKNEIFTKRSNSLIAGLFIALMILFVGCDETADEGGAAFEEEETAAFEAEESVENYFEVVESITNSAIALSEQSTGGRIVESEDPEIACAEVTFEGSEHQGRIEINFGDGCVGPDGKTRKGIIVVEYAGHWLVTDSKIYTVLKDFYIDDVKIEGTRILTNISIELQSLVYKVEIIGGKVTWPGTDGVTYSLTRESDRLHTWIFGDGIDDFELHVEGDASGTNKNGVEYAVKIQEPLIFKSNCRKENIYMPSSGIKIIEIPERPSIKVDYGMGDCDKKFTVEIGERNKEVTI